MHTRQVMTGAEVNSGVNTVLGYAVLDDTQFEYTILDDEVFDYQAFDDTAPDYAAA